MWLSLVEYLNGVQGVGGSNPLTQTSPSVLTEFEFVRTLFFFIRPVPLVNTLFLHPCGLETVHGSPRYPAGLEFLWSPSSYKRSVFAACAPRSLFFPRGILRSALSVRLTSEPSISGHGYIFAVPLQRRKRLRPCFQFIQFLCQLL